MSGNGGYPRYVKHGLRHLPEYKIWQSIKDRVLNTKCKAYPNYGGRGVKLCDRWSGKAGVVNFYADMGPRPSPEHSIDRIDNDGDYCPENCRWTTRSVQNRNQRSNVMLTFEGKTQCITDWAAELGLDRRCIRSRLDRGWSIERALSTPCKTSKAAL